MSEKLDYAQLWDKTMLDVLSEVDKKDFNRWIKLKFIHGENNIITLSAPSDVHISKIKTNYIDIIKKSLKNHTETEIQLIFTADDLSKTNTDSRSVNTKTDTVIQSKPKNTQNLQLNEDYTFDNYIRGDNNYFAVSAAEAVSRNIGGIDKYNPLFIYGGVGLGKTHLIQAIANYAQQKSNLKVVYITAEFFLNEFLEHINKGNMAIFKKKYRSADLLLIDDIHTFENKPGCQEELFHTFTALHNAKKQMVFTCDRPVSELKHYSERLISRLKSGLQADIQIPQYETRYAIINKKIENSKINIPEEVIDLICRNISTNVRDIVGAINQISGYAELTKKPITIESAQKQLILFFNSIKQSNISVDTIIQVIAAHFDISISDIKGKKRTASVVYVRHLAMYIARTITEFSLTEIGRIFGGKDHTTVLNAVNTVEKNKISNPIEEAKIQTLIKEIKEFNVK